MRVAVIGGIPLLSPSGFRGEFISVVYREVGLGNCKSASARRRLSLPRVVATVANLSTICACVVPKTAE